MDKGWSRRGEDNEIIIQKLFSQGSIIGKQVLFLLDELLPTVSIASVLIFP